MIKFHIYYSAKNLFFKQIVVRLRGSYRQRCTVCGQSSGHEKRNAHRNAIRATNFKNLISTLTFFKTELLLSILTFLTVLILLIINN